MENLGASGIRGTAIYVKSGTVSYEVKNENAQYKDQVWVEIPLKDNEKLLCGCIYRSPNGNIEETASSIKEIGNILIQASSRKPSHLLVAGDFNHSHKKEIVWKQTMAYCCMFLCRFLWSGPVFSLHGNLNMVASEVRF